SSRERATADARHARHDIGVDPAGMQSSDNGARAYLDLGRRLSQHREHRNLPERALGLEIEPERRLERGQRELVDSHCAREWILAKPRYNHSFPQDNAGLRTPQQLVTTHQNKSGTCA